MSEQNETQRLDSRGYPMPRDGWTCYHCGETFTTWGSARDHFGISVEYTAACQLGGERGLVMKLRKSEIRAEEQIDRALQAEREVENLECRVAALTADFKSFKPFRDCNSANEAFFVYDSMEGRALAAEEALASVRGENKRFIAELQNMERRFESEMAEKNRVIERMQGPVTDGIRKAAIEICDIYDVRERRGMTFANRKEETIAIIIEQALLAERAARGEKA